MPTATTTEHRGTASTSSSASLGNWHPERVVLTHILDQHPRRLTLPELTDEVGAGLRTPEVMRAVNNLAAARFLFRDGADVVPAPAVVRFDRTNGSGLEADDNGGTVRA
jgi:hypothetical protein